MTGWMNFQVEKESGVNGWDLGMMSMMSRG
jgi:hypothetical protein